VYRTSGIYPSAEGAADGIVTYSTTDGVYGSIDPAIAQMLTLTLDGDLTTSVSSTISLALITNVTGLLGTTTTTTTTTTPRPVAMPVVAVSPSVTMPSPSPMSPVRVTTNATTTTTVVGAAPFESSRAAFSVQRPLPGTAGMFVAVTTAMMITLFAGTTAVVSLLL
jgi:hypothetical protein